MIDPLRLTGDDLVEPLSASFPRGVRGLINIRNPIGPKRFSLMPKQPYTR